MSSTCSRCGRTRPVGINSAGIGQREWDAPIIFAGVQSVWRNAARLGPRHLVLIDEAHLVPHDGDGMYRSLLAELRALAPADGMRIAGFSATPFRLDSGRLDEGEGKIFDDVVFDYGIGQGIRDGWLSPLTSKATGTEINISGVGRRGGEFIAGELERAADDNAADRRRLRRDRCARCRSAIMAGLLLRRRRTRITSATRCACAAFPAGW